MTEETKNILVEAAWFDPATVRASSRRHGLHTDASHRFERGADFNGAPAANHLVTRLVVEQCGGEVVGPLVDVQVPELAAKTANRAPIMVRVGEVRRHLGTTLEDLKTSGGAEASSLNAALVEQYLTALGCELTPAGTPGEYVVKLPSWRLDLEREIDLVEEVARVHGYNRFADTLPGFSGAVVELPHAGQEAAIRRTMLSLGYSESVSSTFASAEEAATFGDKAAGAVAMGNPLSEEAGMLRPSLVSGMATMLALNLHRDVNAVRLFELGTLFTGSSKAVHEENSLVLGATGAAVASSLHKAEDALFFEVKGALETLLTKFAGVASFDKKELPGWMAEGRGARALLNGKPVAVFGELNAAQVQRLKLRQACVVAEVKAQALFASPLRSPIARDLSRFQAAERDFSFVFPDAVRWDAVQSALLGLNLAEMQSVAPVEIFRDAKGKAVAAGSYSMLVRVVFQSMERTLTEEELSGWSERIVASLTALGGVQRA